jgi:hypothetical protein
MLPCSPTVIASLFVALAAGAGVESPYRTSNLQEVKGDGMSAVITHARSEAEGRALAEGYCHAHGGAARLMGIVQYRTKRETSKVVAFDRYERSS